MIFETHAHYDDERFEEDRDALITSMPGRGVGAIINVGASIESTKQRLRCRRSIRLSMQQSVYIRAISVA